MTCASRSVAASEGRFCEFSRMVAGRLRHHLAGTLRDMTALHTDQHRRLVDALVEARVAAGLTQMELSDRLGLRHDVIAKIETYRRRLDVIEFLRYAAALKVDPAKLIAKVGDIGSFKRR